MGYRNYWVISIKVSPRERPADFSWHDSKSLTEQKITPTGCLQYQAMYINIIHIY